MGLVQFIKQSTGHLFSVIFSLADRSKATWTRMDLSGKFSKSV